ncbi:serine/threonine protein kinase [Polyangium sp. 6x1]|uniref:serine/threonine-protein kinase n=1 Tax=Polyangium sp. 6x1 TaxID=3042689 RepID=UPI002482FED0|nr:serine/threonine protein kinase [Polyangium sp. 6x1]MDI1443957.1 protein kinase [Polyangium sp. 6x1]
MTSAQNPIGPSDPPAAPQGYKPTLLDGTPYRFIAPLGRGGMGDVVEAEHVALGKRVVVKLLQERHASRADFVDRMRIEAQALAKITHPNLVQVTDFGQTAEGRTFLVMERLYGRNLREELEQRKFFPVAEAIDVVRQTLAGLAAAHDAGVVHRDVKLDNLFLCDAPDGGRRLVKVLDFGVAKVISVTGESTPLPLAFPTAEGVAMGTPRFFSPEQARGRPVDGRADLYAAGMVLYTLLAGRGPFEHITTLLELTRAHAFQVPEPPSRYAAQALPAGLDAIVMKALAKEPVERFATARTFAAELERVADGLSASNIRPRWDATDVMPTVPRMQKAPEPVVDDEPATMRVDALPRGALPKAMPDDDDEAPDTPTRRLERPMPFMRAQRKSAVPPLPLPEAPPAIAPAPLWETKPSTTISEPPKTLENIPYRPSEPPTLARPEMAASQPAKPQEATSSPDPMLDATLTSAMRAPKPPSDTSALPPDPILDATFPSGPRVEDPAAARSPSEHPAANRVPSEHPSGPTRTGSERPTSSGGTGRADRISALPGRNPDRPSIVPGREGRVSVLPGRTDRTSALPTKPERTSALPARAERTERTSNVPPRAVEPAVVPERRSNLPAAAPLHPPAPLPEERISVPPPGPGGVRPLRAPVPWRRRPAAGSTSGAARGATTAAQNKPVEVEKGKQQTTILAIVAALAIVVAGVLLALRFLR